MAPLLWGVVSNEGGCPRPQPHGCDIYLADCPVTLQGPWAAVWGGEIDPELTGGSLPLNE